MNNQLLPLIYALGDLASAQENLSAVRQEIANCKQPQDYIQGAMDEYELLAVKDNEWTYQER